MSSAPVCPVCQAPVIEIRAKQICSRCHMILETCCEGGRCEYPEPAADGDNA